MGPSKAGLFFVLTKRISSVCEYFNLTKDVCCSDTVQRFYSILIKDKTSLHAALFCKAPKNACYYFRQQIKYGNMAVVLVKYGEYKHKQSQYLSESHFSFQM